MKPNYCIAIAITSKGASALAVGKVYKDVIAAAVESDADRVDIYRNGSYQKTIRPSGLKHLQATRAAEKKAIQGVKTSAKPPAQKAKAKAKPTVAAEDAAPEEPEGDPLG